MIDDTGGLFLLVPDEDEFWFDNGLTEETCPGCGEAPLRWIRSFGSKALTCTSKTCKWRSRWTSIGRSAKVFVTGT